MKSTKTIFAISSIRCIKPLNSSSSCSPEQVYFSKKEKKKKRKKEKTTKTKQKIFIKCYNAKKEKKRKKEKKKEKKENFNFLGVHKDHEDLSKCMTGFLWFVHFVFNLCFFFPAV